jgi:hypothetical protein
MSVISVISAQMPAKTSRSNALSMKNAPPMQKPRNHRQDRLSSSASARTPPLTAWPLRSFAPFPAAGIVRGSHNLSRALPRSRRFAIAARPLTGRVGETPDVEVQCQEPFRGSDWAVRSVKRSLPRP